MKRAALFVDTHAHLTDALFDGDRGEVIERAAEAGVDRILTVATDLASSIECVELAARHSGVEAAVGIHPSRATTFRQDRNAVLALLERPGVRAVGEIGLDFGRCAVPRAEQMEAFRAQVGWAVEAGLPVVVHDREAHGDVLGVLSEFGARGVLHCFSGDAGLALEAASMDLYVSFAGNVTYKSANDLHAAARAVPSDRLLIETDSPYLPPQGWRGRRNEPAHVTAVGERIAELRSVEPAELARVSSANAASLFSWSMAA